MKHSKLFIFAIMTTLAVSGCKHQAATYPTDTLTTKNGSQLTITFFKHASLAIETEGRHIYIDPISQYADYASLPKADLILITHSHYDHLDSAAVAALSTVATTVVCDRTSSETLGGKCLTMKPGDTLAPRDYLSTFMKVGTIALLAVGILVRHLQFGIIFAGRIRSESESDGTRSAGRHIADILRGLRGGDAVTLDGRFDIGYIPLALVHVFHGNGGFLARIDGVWKHGIAQFETVGLRNRYGNLDIRSVGIAGAAIDILVFEVDIDALRAVLRTRQHLHGHGLGQGIARPQRIVIERVRTAGNGEILAAINGHDHIADSIRQAMTQYFHDLDGEAPAAVYDMVLARVEKPLLEIVLDYAGGNQTRAAEVLGLNRNTLRKKMKLYQLL